MLAKHNFYILLISSTVFATLNGNEITTPPSANSQIESLQKELDFYRQKEANEEIEAQQSMRTDWAQFTKDINTSEDTEKRILELKSQIDKLKEQQQPSGS